jgi:ankyrin repeat protein
MKITLWALAAGLVLPGAAEGADAAKARKKLDDGYIPFTGAEFVQRAGSDDRKAVDLFIEAGIPLDSTDDRGRTALHAVADEADTKILAALLKAGASPNVADKNGTTPLCVAADRGVAANVTLLLQARADVTAHCGTDRRTALHEAAGADHANVAQLLVAAGAPLNARDRRFETPLIQAAGEAGGAALRVLLAAHAK